MVGLILVPTLSPCATTLPVFLTAAGSNDHAAFAVLAALLLASTLTVSPTRFSVVLIWRKHLRMCAEPL